MKRPSPEPENATPPPPLPPAPEPHKVTLNTGMLLPVRLVDGLSSERNAPGDAFLATLDKELVVDGFVIAERGARVEGRVVASDPGGKMKRAAAIAVELTRLSFRLRAPLTSGCSGADFQSAAELYSACLRSVCTKDTPPPFARGLATARCHYVSFIVAMRLSAPLTLGVLSAALCLCGQGQDTSAKGTLLESKGLPPRATPADYQAQVKTGTVTIAAEFAGHSVPTPQGPLTTEDFVVVELGLFGAPDARLKIADDDFSLRINGKKAALPTRPFGMVLGSVKDPEWQPPEPAKSKSKTSLGGGGGGDQADPNTPPPPVKIPLEVQRAMAQRVQKATLPEGDRTLPQAGLIYFQYHGNAKGIHSVELIYDGPAGKTTLALQP
ncbi:MAG TPA: hypothetical protein VKF41_03480 [Bryobacteraceae bacterium]|nr:hypothetical protein [Bryobacteraceae bacterium]